MRRSEITKCPDIHEMNAVLDELIDLRQTKRTGELIRSRVEAQMLDFNY